MDTNQNQKVSCIANYVYEASEPDELSVKPGDVLRDVERLPGGWWRGELRGRRGMFPDNFVSVITEHGNTRSSVQGRCRAVFSYQPANPDELALNVGDVLDVLAEVEEGWWQGRRQGRVGVFPSNFVVMLDPPQTAPFEPAPALPPKPVKELCRVLFPYTAMNEDELTLSEGDIVTLVSKDAPDRGWWKGELHGRVGLFPDNFVELLPPVTHDLEREEKKPERPPSKTNVIYPILNKYSEKTASVKELTTSRISLHKENTVSKENSIQSTVTHTNKNESEKIVHTETVTDSTDGQIKKPPVPLKKSPTPTSGVSSLLSGLKNKMMPSSDKDKDKQAPLSHSSSGEWDRPDGLAASKPASRASTLDHVERNSMLQDPRAGRVKAPRRRPPSQVFRDDTPMTIGLSNGHEVPTEIPVEKEKEKEREKDKEKAEEIKPRAREWEKHRAPWMAELKLNQAKKTSFGSDGKSRSQSSSSEGGVACKAGSGSTDRILDCGLEEKRSSTHSMEMSKSTSSISTKMAVVENVESFEETKVRQSLDSKDSSRLSDPPVPATKPPQVQSPTAAGRTITTMLDEIRKPPAPTPPAASVRTSADFDKSPNKFRISADFDKSPNKTVISSERSDVNSFSKTSTSGVVEKSTTEMLEKTELKETLERIRSDKSDGAETLIAQLSNRILNLEKLLEVQNAKFNAAIEDLTKKLNAETEKRLALQSEMEKLAHCVTQV